MANRDYLNELQINVQKLHNCGAIHRGSVAVHEKFSGKGVWRGQVEIFDLVGHPKAKRAYAWSQHGGPKTEKTQIVAVLEIPPVVDAKTAVQASMAKEVRATPESPG